MGTHADGWKDEEADVNDSKEDYVAHGDPRRGEVHKTATFWFDLKDVDDSDIQHIIEEVERTLRLFPGSCGVTVGS